MTKLNIKPERQLQIERYIREICYRTTLPREPVNSEPMIRLLAIHDFIGAINLIKMQMGLHEAQIDLAEFFHDENRKACAFIRLPEIMPIFGSKDFKNKLFVINIRHDYLYSGQNDLLIKSIAHELSHIILRSTASKLKESEEATDLMAMCSGFHEIYLRGFEAADRVENRKYRNKDESIDQYKKRLEIINNGNEFCARIYLSTDEVRFACQLIKNRLDLRRQ